MGKPSRSRAKAKKVRPPRHRRLRSSAQGRQESLWREAERVRMRDEADGSRAACWERSLPSPVGLGGGALPARDAKVTPFPLSHLTPPRAWIMPQALAPAGGIAKGIFPVSPEGSCWSFPFAFSIGVASGE